MSQMWIASEHKGDEIAGIYSDPEFRHKASVARHIRAKAARERAALRRFRVGRQGVWTPFFARPAPPA